MKVYILKQYDYDYQPIYGVFDNIEDLSQAVENIIARHIRHCKGDRAKALEFFGVEVYDLNAYHEDGRGYEHFYDGEVLNLLYPQNN